MCRPPRVGEVKFAARISPQAPFAPRRGCARRFAAVMAPSKRRVARDARSGLAIGAVLFRRRVSPFSGEGIGGCRDRHPAPGGFGPRTFGHAFTRRARQGIRRNGLPGAVSAPPKGGKAASFGRGPRHRPCCLCAPLALRAAPRRPRLLRRVAARPLTKSWRPSSVSGPLFPYTDKRRSHPTSKTVDDVPSGAGRCENTPPKTSRKGAKPSCMPYPHFFSMRM